MEGFSALEAETLLSSGKPHGHNEPPTGVRGWVLYQCAVGLLPDDFFRSLVHCFWVSREARGVHAPNCLRIHILIRRVQELLREASKPPSVYSGDPFITRARRTHKKPGQGGESTARPSEGRSEATAHRGHQHKKHKQRSTKTTEAQANRRTGKQSRHRSRRAKTRSSGAGARPSKKAERREAHEVVTATQFYP